MSDLSKAILEINKKFGENTIGKISDMSTIKIDRLSTGSPYLDWATGGGWPLGRSIELYGPYSSGKSLIALRTLVQAQKQGLKCIYLDSESGFDPDFAEKVGVNVQDLVISQISAGEETFDIVNMLIDSKDVSVIIVDSVASLVPDYEERETMDKQTIGLHARLMSKAMRKITGKASKSKTLIMFINQIREKPTNYGNHEITTGGRALGFYCSIRLEVRRGELTEDGKKNVIGQQVKFKVTKSKVCSPFRGGYFMFSMPDANNPNLELFDTADELVSMLLLQNKIIRRGAYYDVVGKTFQGREELEREIRIKPEFREELTNLWKGKTTSKKEKEKNGNV